MTEQLNSKWFKSTEMQILKNNNHEVFKVIHTLAKWNILNSFDRSFFYLSASGKKCYRNFAISPELCNTEVQFPTNSQRYKTDDKVEK